jgi:hypothetical protein
MTWFINHKKTDWLVKGQCSRFLFQMFRVRISVGKPVSWVLSLPPPSPPSSQISEYYMGKGTRLSFKFLNSFQYLIHELLRHSILCSLSSTFLNSFQYLIHELLRHSILCSVSSTFLNSFQYLIHELLRHSTLCSVSSRFLNSFQYLIHELLRHSTLCSVDFESVVNKSEELEGCSNNYY